VAVDIEDGGAIGVGTHDMGIPEFVVERFLHGQSSDAVL
jgi:hypothetical protein